MNLDQVTLVIKQAFKLLFVEYPERTSVGALVGGFLFYLFTVLLKPSLLAGPLNVLTELTPPAAVMIGIVIFHVRTIWRVLTSDKTSNDLVVDKVFAIVDGARKRGMSKKDAGQLSKKIVERYLETIRFQENLDEPKNTLPSPVPPSTNPPATP